MATFIENVSYSPHSLLHNSFVLRHPFVQIVIIIIIIIIIIMLLNTVSTTSLITILIPDICSELHDQ